MGSLWDSLLGARLGVHVLEFQSYSSIKRPARPGGGPWRGAGLCSKSSRARQLSGGMPPACLGVVWDPFGTPCPGLVWVSLFGNSKATAALSDQLAPGMAPGEGPGSPAPGPWGPPRAPAHLRVPKGSQTSPKQAGGIPPESCHAWLGLLQRLRYTGGGGGFSPQGNERHFHVVPHKAALCSSGHVTYLC